MKHLTNRGRRIWTTADFSSETMQARRQQSDIFKYWKKKKCQPKILYPVKFLLSLKVKGNKDSQTNINWENLLPAKMPYKNVKGRSRGKRNVIKIRNLNLHQEIKSTGNGVNVGIVFLISLRDNWMLKALTTMPLTMKNFCNHFSNVSSASLSFFWRL